MVRCDTLAMTGKRRLNWEFMMRAAMSSIKRSGKPAAVNSTLV